MFLTPLRGVLSYSVPLPWKQGIAIIPDNFQLSSIRLNPDLLTQYDDFIKQQEEDGVVESLDNDIHCPVLWIPHSWIHDF